MFRLCTVVLALALVLPGNAAWSQVRSTTIDKAKPTTKAKPKITLITTAALPTYQGVTPQGGDPPVIKTPPPGIAYVTWPGFRVTKTGAEIFIQLTSSVAYQQTAKKKTIVVTLDKTQIYHKNNSRKVITRHFAGSPVESFKLQSLKNDQVKVTIRLKKKAGQPTLTSRAAGKYTFMFVTFPLYK